MNRCDADRVEYRVAVGLIALTVELGLEHGNPS